MPTLPSSSADTLLLKETSQEGVHAFLFKAPPGRNDTIHLKFAQDFWVLEKSNKMHLKHLEHCKIPQNVKVVIPSTFF